MKNKEIPDLTCSMVAKTPKEGGYTALTLEGTRMGLQLTLISVLSKVLENGMLDTEDLSNMFMNIVTNYHKTHSDKVLQITQEDEPKDTKPKKKKTTKEKKKDWETFIKKDLGG